MPDLFDQLSTEPSPEVEKRGLGAAGEGTASPADLTWPDLNGAQRQAVTSSLAPQLVVAGPGTGKTRVLVCRAAYLLTEHGDRLRPSDLAVITFTRKAARQLTTRLADIIGAQAQHVRAGTIHRFCAQILQRHGEAVGVDDDLIVAPEAVTDAHWQRWFEANERWCRQHDLGTFRQVKLRVSRAKLGIETIPGRLQSAMREYDRMLASRGALDFDDLLVKARDAVNISEIRSALRRETGAILVDEFQDTDPVQFHVIQQLTATSTGDPGAHLFCVADDDQSIYRFRGARPKNLRDLIDTYGCSRENGTLHVLKMNYRSNRAIYAVAESVLPPEERLKRRGEIETTRADAEPVTLTAYETEEAEMDAALRRIRAWIEDGVAMRDMAVLAPWNSLVKDLEARCLRAGIACEASSTDPIMETMAMRRVLATFTLVERVVNTGQIPDGPLEDLLSVVMPEDVVAVAVDIASRQNASLWGIFQLLAGDRSAAERAGLGADWEHLGRSYAAIGNVMQHARTEDATIGSLASETLRQLGGTTQLLAEQAGPLPDPLQAAGVEEASSLLRDWRERRSEGARLLVHDRNTRQVRILREMIRRALDLADAPGRVPNQSPAVFVANDQETPRPLGPGDVVCTTNAEAFLQWADRHGAVDRDGPGPRIIDLSGGSISPERLDLLGLGADRCIGVAPDTYRLPALRLFGVLQATVAPHRPEPAFPEYVMVDLETTSLDVRQCRVAEIGAVRVRDGEEVDAMDVQVQLPDDLTDEEADTLRTVCGMDLDADFSDAVPLAEAWSAFATFAGDVPIVAHNGRQFDFRILNRLASEVGDGARPWTTTFDTLPVATKLCPDLPRHTARHLREALLGDDSETVHRALADCRDQQQILAALQARRAALQRTTALEPLLPLVLAATLVDVVGRDLADRSPPWSEAERVLLETGYRWALRDASPAAPALRRLLPQALPEWVRATPVLYDAFDEDHLLSTEADGQPGLTGRLDALLAPYREAPIGQGLRDVLSHLALWGHEDPEQGEDVVTLSTYHSAKGLEFERVLCTGVHDSAFPAFHAKSKDARAESRRLLYVGLTRAEQHLVITYSTTDRFGRDRHMSPFLKSAPAEWIGG